MSKKAFDLARNSIYVAAPEDLCIIGGLSLPAGEQGPLDTGDGHDHELWDPRLRKVITPESVANVDAYGIITPITICKLGEVPTVVAGRGRVRRARLANKLRRARGEPAISIECKVARVRGTGGLLGLMIAENEVREDDNIAAKIAKLRILLSRGVSEADAAVIFGASIGTIKGWLRYEDGATTEVKAAVASGEIAMSTAAIVSRRDPAAQAEVMAKLRAAPAKSARAARAAVSDKPARPGGKLIKLVAESAYERAERQNDDEIYWRGIVAAIEWFRGGTPDPKLIRLIDRLQEKTP